MEKGSQTEKARELAARIDRMIMSRREFLRRSGVGVVAVGVGSSLLAACGGDEEVAAPAEAPPATTEAPPATTEAPPATTEAATTAAAEVPPASGEIDYLSWEGYDLPDIITPWLTENGVTVNPTYVGDHNEIQAKIKAGGGSVTYDLITYYQGYKPLYTELEILTPLDPAKLPNLANQFDYFASDIGNFWVDSDGTRTGVPWTWGSFGITYDSAKGPEITSWYDLLDPKFKGKIGTVSDPVGGVTLTARILGYDASKLTEEQYAETKDLFTQFADQTNGVSPSYGDLTTKLVAGDVLYCYEGWAAMNSFAAAAGLETVKTASATEGSASFCDAWAIPPTADNTDTALAWINEVITPEINAQAAIYLVGGVTVADAVSLLDDATRSLYPYDDLDQLLENAPFFNNPPVESDEYVTIDRVIKDWQEIVSGA
jgi:spermidine/putrescine transport system substrate-binding protein